MDEDDGGRAGFEPVGGGVMKWKSKEGEGIWHGIVCRQPA